MKVHSETSITVILKLFCLATYVLYVIYNLLKVGHFCGLKVENLLFEQTLIVLFLAHLYAMSAACVSSLITEKQILKERVK